MTWASKLIARVFKLRVAITDEERALVARLRGKGVPIFVVVAAVAVSLMTDLPAAVLLFLEAAVT